MAFPLLREVLQPLQLPHWGLLLQKTVDIFWVKDGYLEFMDNLVLLLAEIV